MKALKFICEIYKKFPKLLIVNTMFLIIASLLNAATIFTVGPLVDFVVHPNLQGISPLTQKAIDILRFFNIPITISVWLIVFFVFVLFSSIFQIFARYSILYTKYVVVKDIMVGTFDDFFNAKWYFFSSGEQGVFLNTFIRETQIVGDAFGAMALFFASILRLAIFLGVPFYLSWQVTLISLVVAIIFAVPFILAGKFSYKLGLLNTQTGNYLSTIINENLILAKVILGFGNQAQRMDIYKKAFDAQRSATLKSQTLNLSMPILYQPFAVLVVIIALVSANKFQVPLSELTVLLVALLQVGMSIGTLTMQKTSLENFFPSYEQITRLRKRACEMKQVSGHLTFNTFKKEIRIKDVSFEYIQDKPVLRDIDFSIKKGTMVAFVGKSGVGKSTLIDIIMGFHEPTSGKVFIDDIPLSDFDINSYRKRIGYVPQDSVLFNLSIKDNLLWSKPDALDEKIEKACKLANAYEFIIKLPEGYNTIVGDRGVRLSGGQVQRIALARAILRNPDILFLDEATSSLDTFSEKLIQEAIEKVAKETTVIVIAHRLSTIKKADCIYVLDDGKITEAGSYSELINKKGHFSSMAQLQELQIS